MRAIEGRISGNHKKQGPYREIRIDGTTHKLITINHAHHEVHGGDAFFANHYATLGNGDVLGIGITTPNTTKWLHVALHALGTADALLTVTEGGTLGGGAAQTLYNQDRNSTTASGAAAIIGNTGANVVTMVGGTVIYGAGLGDGSPIDWSRQAGEEMILKQNTQYLFQIENGVNANIASLTLRWYEHINRD